MDNTDLMLLDCTLRDGGYINDWKWGFSIARTIISQLIDSNIDIVEVGFLRNVSEYDQNITVCNSISELNRLLPERHGRTVFSAMAMQSNYDIDKLEDYAGSGIEMIRVTFHDYDIEEGLEFARAVKRKGYKLSINPINIMGYTDGMLFNIIEKVNDIHPFQFSIVDTFGSMRRRDLDRIVSLVDNNLKPDIRIALHLHENMSLGFSLAQSFIDKHLKRPITIDGSLMGIGRTPGNLPIELISDYLNEYCDKNYNIDYMMDAIQDYISQYKGESNWGYTPAYFLSAKYNLHRNYAEHYLRKGDLTNRDIRVLLSRIEKNKKTAFDSNYADRLYEEFKNVEVDDCVARTSLKSEFAQRIVMVMAPGKSIVEYKDKVSVFLQNEGVILVSVNFIPENYDVNYAFFSNSKRYSMIPNHYCKEIVTSNITLNGDNEKCFVIDHNSLSGEFNEGLNSFIMCLKLLKEIGCEKVFAAGADGYSINSDNYYNNLMFSYIEHGNSFNNEVKKAIRRIGISVEFVTPSAYADK